MTTYQIGTSAATLVDVDTVLDFQPKSRYAPGGERIIDHAGDITHAGFPRSVWQFAGIPITAWATLKTTYLGGEHSGEVYVRTRDDEDTWATYRARLRLPDVSQLNRWGGYYLDVELELVLLEVIP